MKVTVVVPVLNEKQTVGDVVRLTRSSPVVDEVVVFDDIVGDVGYKNQKGNQMKIATKTVTAFLGALCMLALVGCPKRAVLSSQPQETNAEPVGQDQLAGFKWSLGTIHFDFDKSDIRTGDATVLQGNYDQMKAAAVKNEKPGITIEGYCDPVGTSEYNMALGMRRAEATKAYLVKLGADARQLTTISYGEEELVTQDEGVFELNRRCEFEVTK